MYRGHIYSSLEDTYIVYTTAAEQEYIGHIYSSLEDTYIVYTTAAEQEETTHPLLHVRLYIRPRTSSCTPIYASA
jgi:hypothetical protein